MTIKLVNNTIKLGMGVGVMKKDEILNRSRQEKRDEGMEYVKNNGLKIGFVAFSLVFIFIVIFNFFMGMQNHSVFALYWTFFAVAIIPKYQFTKNKAYLIAIIGGIVAATISLISFVITSVR